MPEVPLSVLRAVHAINKKGDELDSDKAVICWHLLRL